MFVGNAIESYGLSLLGSFGVVGLSRLVVAKECDESGEGTGQKKAADEDKGDVFQANAHYADFLFSDANFRRAQDVVSGSSSFLIVHLYIETFSRLTRSLIHFLAFFATRQIRSRSS